MQSRLLSLRSTISSSQSYIRSVFEGRPLTKFFVIASGVVFTAGSFLEIYGRRKKEPKSVRLMPPALNHNSILRIRELGMLDETTWSPVVIISGCALSGKTELSRQYAERFVEKHTKGYALKALSLFKRQRCHVISLQGNSLFTLSSSLRLAALKLGCRAADLPSGSSDSLHILSYCQAIREKLQNTNSLIIFDHVSEMVMKHSSFQMCLEQREWGDSKALLLVESERWSNHNVVGPVAEIKLGELTKEEAVELLGTVSGRDVTSDRNAIQLATTLSWSPGALACAAVGLKYSPGVSMSEYKDQLDHYITRHTKSTHPKLMSLNCENDTCDLKLAKAAIVMAVESLAKINSFMHDFASLLICLHSSTVVVPSSALLRYIGKPILPHRPQLPSFPQQPQQDVVQQDPSITASSPVEESTKSPSLMDSWNNLTATAKSVVMVGRARFGLGVPKSEDSVNTTVDQEAVVRSSIVSQLQLLPCVRWVKQGVGMVETIVTNSLVQEALTDLVIDRTVKVNETVHIEHERSKHENTWLAHLLWSFNEKNCLEKFRQRLSGKAGNKSQVVNSVSLLAHEVGHLCRLKSDVLKCLVTESSSVNDMSQEGTTRGLLLEQIEFLTSLPLHQHSEKLQLQSLLAKAAIYSDVLQDHQHAKVMLQQALMLAKSEFSGTSIQMAKAVSDLGMIAYAMDDFQYSRQLLEQSLGICESLTSTREFLTLSQEEQVDITLTMSRVLSRLGSTCGALGYHQQSREYFEKVVMLMQSLPPDSSGDFPHASEFSTAMTDLGHAYLLEGRLVYAKKVLELARNLNKNLRGEEHPQVVRTMEILSIVLLMMGDKGESSKMMADSAKLRDSINAKLISS